MSDLTFPLHCGCAAPVEWEGNGVGLWLVQPRKRLGDLVAGAAATVKRLRLKCPECQAKGKLRQKRKRRHSAA